MSLDHLICKIRDSRRVSPPKFDPNNFIHKRHSIVPGSNKVYIIFPGWRSGLKHSQILRNTLTKRGQSCLEYEFHPDILTSDPQQTLDCFEQIKKDGLQEIENLKQIYNFKNIQVIGMSLGGMHAYMVSNHNPNIDKLTLVCTGYSLAESLWDGIATQHLRKNMEKQGITLDQLETLWGKIHPYNNIDGLTGKKIQVFLSKADKLIRYSGGKKIVNAMKELGLDPQVEENRFLGHYITIWMKYNSPGKIIS
ncbi:alpha/beta hydrolase [archaeon]|nr:alpha/beta hydrolase [archaeon]